MGLLARPPVAETVVIGAELQPRRLRRPPDAAQTLVAYSHLKVVLACVRRRRTLDTESQKETRRKKNKTIRALRDRCQCLPIGSVRMIIPGMLHK